MRSQIIVACFVFASLAVWQEPAEAQFNSSIFQQNLALRGRGFQSARSSILGRPTTSPYLALTDLSGVGLDNSSSYFTSVRPRLERERNSQQQQLQIQNVQRQMSAMRSAAAQRSQNGMRATGHPTRFQLYLQYYPGLR